jgi:hypothetical protein
MYKKEETKEVSYLGIVVEKENVYHQIQGEYIKEHLHCRNCLKELTQLVKFDGCKYCPNCGYDLIRGRSPKFEK